MAAMTVPASVPATVVRQASVLDPQGLLEAWGEGALWTSVAVVFAECGLFLFFMPGDSLLFTVGMMLGTGVIDQPVWSACLAFGVAAFAGNVVGYEIGRACGPAVLERPGSRLFTAERVQRTRSFFDTYGPRALVLARFTPVVRTFITFTAGAVRMDRRRYLLWSGVGAVLWGVGVPWLGYALGAVPVVRENYEAALLVTMVVSLLPTAVEWWLGRRAAAVRGVGPRRARRS